MAATDESNRRNSNTLLLEELEELSQSLYQSNFPTTANRRTASLVLPRTSIPGISTSVDVDDADEKKLPNTSTTTTTRPRSRRMSLSPWRSRPKLDDVDNDDDHHQNKQKKTEIFNKLDQKGEKKGIWNWKPIRVLSHIGMQKLSCLFSVEVVTIQGLPGSMNGLRLSVCVRKKESKDGGVNTMPSRVSQGAADFEETLFLKCHVYCSPPGGGQMLKFDPRPFWIYAVAVDAKELNFGRNCVDLSQLIKESMEKSIEGTRVRQWDTSFDLSGKAKGGQLVLKLGFQIMEKEGGIDIYSQAEGSLKSSKARNFSMSPSIGRKQSKTSFSVPSPRLSSRSTAWTPSQTGAGSTGEDLQEIDDFKLDEPALVPVSEEPESKMEDVDLPDFDVVDKGVEIQEKEEAYQSEEATVEGGSSASNEVVKEVVIDQVHMTRINELDSIARQIKAIESMMGEEKIVKEEEETKSQRLDADEETVTREFLQMLELEDEENREFGFNQPEMPPLQLEDTTDSETKVYLPDLGKGLGCVVQTRDGGYLAAMNPLDTLVARKDTPKLAMQISKPLVLPSSKSASGFELFQKMAAVGFEEFSSEILSSLPMDELMGKTAEQIAFEGIASAVIQGRTKEGASSSAARTIAAVKTMATAMSTGRKDRISTGIWNVNENPFSAEEILSFSLQKIETMAVEALKIQAEIAEEDAPFEVSPLSGKTEHLISSAVSLEDWVKKYNLTEQATITLVVGVQLRDPIRRYEAVGGPVIVLIHASSEEIKESKYEEEKKFKVTSLHIGGLKVGSGGKRTVWDSEKQRLTAMQWLLAHGLAKASKKGKHVSIKRQDLLWSISSRVMADMWLRSLRNPDIKFPK
ncbi:hypothetical protein EZV62_021226 [Acer yangbiense]|uniref:C2 NT-type domain-containing protein n=1 Tax=Acer yangbiense TaxID=1000413 RepID=A0A5C7H513_9ROSI|nr:hypothetical protein EZV62_021226 [Acer yangbiense]